jgi:hypothetical protein
MMFRNMATNRNWTELLIFKIKLTYVVYGYNLQMIYIKQWMQIYLT